MKYFVTGGAGFIGANYVNMILETMPNLELVTVYDAFTYAANEKNLYKYASDPRLKVIKGDICNPNLLKKSMQAHDFAIHFAAESHVDRSIKNPEKFIETNIVGTYNVLEACLENEILTTIHVSTDEVYGSISNGSSDENFPLKPNSPYSACKAASDLIARSYFSTYGLDIRITRACNNFGPFQYPEKVIPVFINALLNGKPMPIYGSGANVREWIHVQDHCRGIQKVLENGSPGEIYNIGTGNLLSNIDLGIALKSILGVTSNSFDFVDDRKGHDFRYSLNSTKINNIGYKPIVSFLPGLSETINWYKSIENWWA